MSLHPTQSTVSSSSHPASTYISKFKKIAVGIIFVFAAQMAMIPAQSYAAGCVESGAKAAITTGVVAGGLLFLDCLFGCPVSVATAGTTTFPSRRLLFPRENDTLMTSAACAWR